MNYIAERRQEEKERRRADILDAAEAVGASVGWEALTMDQVARKARLSRALLYVYFKDKPERSEEHTSELQSRLHLVCRLLLEKKKKNKEETDSTTKNAHQLYPIHQPI